MSTTTTKTYTCDVCHGTKGPLNRYADMPKGWKRIDCGFTDPAGHYQDNDKDVCDECLKATRPTPETDQAIDDYRKDAKEKNKDDFSYYFGLCGDLSQKARKLEAERDALRVALEGILRAHDFSEGSKDVEQARRALAPKCPTK